MVIFMHGMKQVFAFTNLPVMTWFVFLIAHILLFLNKLFAICDGVANLALNASQRLKSLT